MLRSFRARISSAPLTNLCGFLRTASQVPQKPELHELLASDGTTATNATEAPIELDGRLLEALSLVDLESEKTIAAVRSSIRFANRIELVATGDDVPPLYTVLEEQDLYLRPDGVTEPSQRAAVLRNARLTEEDYYVAPPGNIPLEFAKPAH